MPNSSLSTFNNIESCTHNSSRESGHLLVCVEACSLRKLEHSRSKGRVSLLFIPSRTPRNNEERRPGHGQLQVSEIVPGQEAGQFD